MKYVLTLLLTVTIAPLVSLAQFTPQLNTAGYNNIVLTITPEFPKEGESVTASITSFAIDLQTVDVAWAVNDAAVTNSIGANKTKITFTLPEGGAELQVTAGSKTLSRRVSGASVDLLWEADTYIPVGYLGRALPVDGASIIAQAIPHVGNVLPQDLIYNWYRNSRALVANSGLGMNTLRIEGPKLYDDFLLSVEVLDNVGNRLARSGVRMESVEPEAILYGRSPLIGILQYDALSINNEVHVVPYFFTIANPFDLEYIWNIDIAGQEAQRLQGNNQDITIANLANNASIDVAIDNPDQLLQSARGQSIINFSSDTDVILDPDYISSFGN